MQTTIKPSPSRNGAAGNTSRALSPDEVRSICEARGFFGGQRKLIAIEKRGTAVAEFNGRQVLEIDVTPELAALWMKNNVRNRNVSDDVVEAYARDMANGDWASETHQGIAFNDQDQLIDGQHRLLAIMKSGKTIRMTVWFGLKSKVDGKEFTTMDCVDRGRTRSVSDQLKIQHGIPNGSVITAVCTCIANVCYGERTRRLSVSNVLEIYHAFEKPIEWVILHKSKEKGLRTAGVLAGFAFAMETEEKRTGARFWEGNREISGMFDQVMTGVNVVDGSPLHKLRGFLTSDQAVLFTRSLDRGLIEMVLLALHLQLQGKKPAELPTPDSPEWLSGVEFFKSLQPDRVAKIAAMFKLPTIAKPGVQPQVPPAPAKKERPTVEQVLVAVEQVSGISRVIITGAGERSRDDTIRFSRVLVVSVSRVYGHTYEAIAAVMKRADGSRLRTDYTVQRNQMTAKQGVMFDAVKERLDK